MSRSQRTSTWRRVRLAEDESGAIVLMAALILVVMLGMSAVVVDLAFLRHDKRASQTAADMGAIAGAFSLPLTPNSTAGGLDACRDAWAYTVENSIIANGAGGDPCGDAQEGDFSEPCDPDRVNVAVGEVDPYRVIITWPVPPHMLTAQDDGAADRPCELVAVQVERTRGFFFARIWGLSEGFTTAPAVASSSPGASTGIPALLVLDPHDCHALLAKGQGRVWVEYFEAWYDEDTGEGEGVPIEDELTGEIVGYEDAPGLIGVDSDAGGNCGSSQPYALDTGTSQHAQVKAGVDENGDFVDGDIWMYALSGPNSAKAYRESTVTEGRVAPRPTPIFAPITRRPVDHRYNCKDSYPNGSDAFVKHPDIPPCPEHAGQVHGPIDGLRDEYGGSGSPVVGFIRYTAYMAQVYGDNNPCDLASGDGPIHLDPGHEDWNETPPTGGWQGWWFDCPNRFRTLTDVYVSGGDVVFDGDVRSGSDGGLYVNYAYDADDDRATPLEEDIVVFLRGGDLTKSAQSTLAFHRAVVHLEDGRFNLGGGDQQGELTWQAPLDGPFRSLALWSESWSKHEMDGQGALTLRGVFFAPNATIEFDGKGGQVNRANAQFLSFRLTMDGQGTLVLRPDPAEALTVPLPGAELIR